MKALTVTLTFDSDLLKMIDLLALTLRLRMEVSNPDDPATDGDDGLSSSADGTIWTITVIVPQGGIGNFFPMKVAAIAGAPFIISETAGITFSRNYCR